MSEDLENELLLAAFHGSEAARETLLAMDRLNASASPDQLSEEVQ